MNLAIVARITILAALPHASRLASTDAELPRVYLDTRVASTPSTGRTLLVHARGNLQAALDSARYGDRIVLDACATFRGNYFLSKKTGPSTQWITVTSAGQVPAEGTRVSPAMAASMCFPKLISPTSNYTLSTNGAAARWRFIGIEFTNDPSQSVVNGTINLGDATLAQNSLAVTPTDIILDRIYVHSPDNTDDRRCVSANSARTALIDSYVSNCKSTFDAQAFTVSNGPGPFKIVNNFLEATGENIATGGADTGIPGLVPSDFEIRRNYITKRLSWKGSPWNEKNLFESKNGKYILIDGNIFENTWVNGQVGYTMALWSANQGGTCSQCETAHLTFSNNLIRNVSAGINLTSGIGLFHGTFVPMHHITIRNNVWIGITNEYGRIFQLDTIPYLTIEHNTAFSPNSSSFVFGNPGKPAAQIIRNNLTGGGTGQIAASWGPNSAAWDAVSKGAGSVWARNLVALAPNWLNPIPSTFYVGTLDEIGLAGGAAAAYSAKATLDDLALAPTSPFKGKGTDGKDVGADIAAIKAAIAGVEQAR